jgi:hypothetical protein
MSGWRKSAGFPACRVRPTSSFTRHWATRPSILTSSSSRDDRGASCCFKRQPCAPASGPPFLCSRAAGSVASTACIGNRVYTDVGEDELYVVLPGKDLSRVADEIGTITEANSKLSQYHRERRRTLATE